MSNWTVNGRMSRHGSFLGSPSRPIEPKPVFAPGQRVVATGSYMHSLTEGREYVVLRYDEPVVTPTFTFPAYVTVMGDLGREVTGHTHRFKPA